ncbi:dihydrolipoamide acetyltransferase family protein [Pedobacter sp. SYSU D00535]|uniref:dihydrolipoamide acetyltransferase family protein n=1 Tax=Pedobacter sp. SYSU D00535 TaxID=2810308 RepID=UPI001A957C5B|nr:dihydrolipoamide acetyltransferase family protein [Pedobacter sp. SYSU D00535]
MAKFELLLPKMGESVAEATVVKWLKQPGDWINEDEAVVEVATDKVDSEVPSPVSGKLVQCLIAENDVAQVNGVIAILEVEGADEAAATHNHNSSPLEVAAAIPVEQLPGISNLDNKVSSDTSSAAGNKSSRFYSPLVKSIAAEEGITLAELDAITGTGAEGRVTKQDVLTYIQQKGKTAVEDFSPAKEPQIQEAPQKQEAAPVAQAPKTTNAHSSPAINIGPGDEIIEMDRMRKMIADHMIMSKEVAAHVTSFVEADVTNLVKWRDRIKASFEKREGEKITFTPVFVQAVAKAIKDFPMINISVNGSQIIKRRDINIGMAAALPSGNLIVPVIKNADQLNLVGLTKAVNDLAQRARANRLQPDEVKDGTFTITNIGPFGNIMGTPMINQPQVAILAIGTIQKKPAVLETEFGDVIAIRHKMYLSMSYDHRVVDGALGGMFLKRVADYLEAWDTNCEI